MADEEKKEEIQGEAQDQSQGSKTEEASVDSGTQIEEKEAEVKAETKEPEAEEAKPEKKPEIKETKPEVDVSKLSEDAVRVVELVEKMSVLELSELVKVLEDKFGVSAAAPIAVAATSGAVAEGEAGGEEKSEFNINITSSGSNKIAVIKAVRGITTIGLKEAKDLVESLPKVIKEGVKKEEAEEVKKKLEEAGATVELQ